MRATLSIVVPIHSFEPGGVERVGLNLAKAWQNSGHDVTVVLGRNEGADRLQAPALRYRCLPGAVSTASFETLWMIWSLFLFLRRQRVDILFCPGNTYGVVCVAMRLLLGRKCPPIVAKISNDLVRADSPWPVRMAYHMWLRVQGHVFDRVVGMAEPMREEIACLMKVPQRRIAIVPDPALDRERVNRLLAIPRSPDRSASVRFLAVGRLVSQKNMPLLIRAFARAFRYGDTLTIVGDGEDYRRLENLVEGLAIGRRVHFTGHLPNPDTWLARSDCLLLSSDYEGVPAVVIEAIAAGLPVIATDCSSSMSMLLGYGARGALVPVGDLDGFARCIADALNLPELRMDQRSFADEFTLERGSEAYLAIMRTMLAAAASPVGRSAAAAVH